MRLPRTNERIYDPDIPPLGEPEPTEPNVGQPLPGDTFETTPEPVPSKTPSLVNTPGASPAEDKIPEGTGIPIEDSHAVLGDF